MILKEYELFKSKREMKLREAMCLLDKAVLSVDRWENFYMEARNMDPSLEELAKKHQCETDGLSP